METLSVPVPGFRVSLDASGDLTARFGLSLWPE